MTFAFIPPAALTPGLYPQNTGQFFNLNQTLSNGATPGTPNNPNINLQVVVEEQHTDDMEIVDHPIEQGAPITDHTFKRPAELVLHIGWTAAQLSQLPEDDTEYLNALAATYNQILTGQSNRVLYTVNTTKRVYTDMAIKNIATITDKDNRNVLMITLAMRQLILVTSQELAVTVPQSQQLFPESTNSTVRLGLRNLSAASNFKAP